MNYYNEILMVLSDRWMTTREINDAIDRRQQTTSRNLRHMERDNEVESKTIKNKRGLCWRLKMRK